MQLSLQQNHQSPALGAMVTPSLASRGEWDKVLCCPHDTHLKEHNYFVQLQTNIFILFFLRSTFGELTLKRTQNSVNYLLANKRLKTSYAYSTNSKPRYACHEKVKRKRCPDYTDRWPRHRALVPLLSFVLTRTGLAAELCSVEINHVLSVPSIQMPKCTALLFVPCLC